MILCYDYRNRVYSADLGRFLQSDPIRFDAGDGNLNRYVGNNAVNLTDPLGLMIVPAAAVGLLAGVGAAILVAITLKLMYDGLPDSDGDGTPDIFDDPLPCP